MSLTVSENKMARSGMGFRERADRRVGGVPTVCERPNCEGADSQPFTVFITRSFSKGFIKNYFLSKNLYKPFYDGLYH